MKMWSGWSARPSPEFQGWMERPHLRNQCGSWLLSWGNLGVCIPAEKCSRDTTESCALMSPTIRPG